VQVRAISSGARRAASVLWVIGAGLAGFTGLLALGHSEVRYFFVYVTVAVALALLAVATYRGNQRAALISLFLLGSQLIGAVGAAWELAYGSDDTAKARHLHELGVNYRLALAANLAFSSVASIVFIWAMVQASRRVRR
jgi:hypothetical protein